MGAQRAPRAPDARYGRGHVRVLMKCPGCDVLMPEDDLVMQAAHMEAEHPEIVAQRRAEAARWDGWEQDG